MCKNLQQPNHLQALISLLDFLLDIRPPREFGYQTSLWTLDLVAKEALKLGWMSRLVSGEAIRQTLKKLGINWKRAKHWITSPDPLYFKKKRREIA